MNRRQFLAAAGVMALSSESSNNIHHAAEASMRVDFPQWTAGSYNYHIEIGMERQFMIENRTKVAAPFRNPASLYWDLVFPDPPRFELQQPYGTSISIQEAPEAETELVTDTSPLHRSVRVAKFHGDLRLQAGFTALCRMHVGLRSRKLVAGKGTPPDPLSQETRNFYLRASKNIDYKESDFQEWMASVGLQRRHDEGDLDYGYRSFRYVHEHYIHDQVARRPAPSFVTASRTCKESVLGCGHSSNLHVALLRANGVPARVLCGRHAVSDRNGFNMLHVRAEFWCESVGWVPVNHGVAVAHYNPDDYFGYYPAELVTYLIDNDLSFQLSSGGKTMLDLLQSVQPLWSGGGGPSSWHVEDSWLVQPAKS